MKLQVLRELQEDEIIINLFLVRGYYFPEFFVVKDIRYVSNN